VSRKIEIERLIWERNTAIEKSQGRATRLEKALEEAKENHIKDFNIEQEKKKAQAALLADSQDSEAPEDEDEIEEFDLDAFMIEFELVPGNDPVVIPEETKKERDWDYDLPYESPKFTE